MSCKLLRILRPKSGIYVTNRSTVVTDAQVKAWCAAVNTQVARDAAPVWRYKAVPVRFLSAASHAPAGAWVVVVMDDADQAGALGYHSTDALGRVYGRVFAKTCIDYGVEPSTTFSHEVLEIFGDPGVDKWSTTGNGYQVPVELCDAVEGGSYAISGVLVSDFLYPEWFRKSNGVPRHGVFNYLGTVTAAFALDAGGYTVRRFSDGSEDQVFGQQANRPYIAAKRHHLSRTARRSG